MTTMKRRFTATGTELRRLVADDYTLLNSTGRIQNKAELIADYTAPGYKIEPFKILEPVEKVWSDGAVMGGLVHLRGTDGGKPFAITLRFADIWAKRNGKWQVVYTHVSRAAGPVIRMKPDHWTCLIAPTMEGTTSS